MEEADQAYLRHRVSTAANRAAADISRQIIAERRDEPEPRVTAAEWLDAHHAAVADDDRDRPIADHDVTDATTDDQPVVDSADDQATDDNGLERGPVVETHVEPDLRAVAAREPRQADEDQVHVPGPEPVAAAVRQARRAIVEIEAREAYERQAEDEHRAERLGRWHDDDQDNHDDTDTDTDEHGDGGAAVEDRADYQPAGPG